MRSPVLRRFALLIAGLGLSVGLAAAGPSDKKAPPPKPTPSAKAQPNLSPAKPDLTLPPPPKADPKGPVLFPKANPKPLPVLPKFEHKLPVALPKASPKPLPLPPKVHPKPGSVPIPQVVTPKPTLPVLPPETKLPGKIGPRPIIIHERPKTGSAGDMPKGPGLKLPGGTKIDQGELTKIKPPVDLTKTKPEKVLSAKPPADFKVKPIALDKIHVPSDAAKVDKLSLATVQANQAFVVNKSFYKAGDYHTKFGTKVAGGYYCYSGKHHCHWHHCMWDPCFGCHYYYCPSATCYYYWCATDYCYHPCHWFVDYGTCYYPWWICGGFGGYGYASTPHVSIFIGW